MSDFLQLVATLREQMNAELTRTDALRPLVWPIAGLLLALSVSVASRADKWLLIVLVVALGLSLSAYIIGYAYFALKDPDSLRSEKYKLHKLAIEQGLLGDSLTGLRKVDANTAPQVLEAAPTITKASDD